MASTMAAVAPFGATSSVAVMLLIDNSGLAQIATAWSDLRDQWLPSLVVRLASAYPSASITTFVQESCSSSNQDVNGEGWSQPRKYYTFNDALLDVRFSTSSPNYGLSASLIQRTVQFLSYTTSMARHIIIVGSSLSSMDPTSNWSRLTQSLVEVSPICFENGTPHLNHREPYIAISCSLL
ncbi:hypothetical protein GYMLUDRAFT_433593 [Collybiopsis luxurians FD-317 M1]|uniref:Mediator of RNA polymerase II transcription subunit 25 n=1 Tax=Collybiopsis luxurians FD-317 M1 TaxID=944289 RepID=A0A0D0CM49_9AGAR|nr:hypothetical protein GYMLUDRAFT_433593 [Collybiopsis luxurians FD-317 M1]